MNPLRRAALKKLGLAAAAPVAMPGALAGQMLTGPAVPPSGWGTASSGVPTVPPWQRLGVPESIWKALRKEQEAANARAYRRRNALMGVIEADIQAMVSLSPVAKARMQARRDEERDRAQAHWRRKVWGDDE